MKVAVLCAGHAQPHAGWVAIDELADLLVHYFDAELLSPRPAPQPWTRRLLHRHRAHYHPLSCDGGDVLVVVAHSPTDLNLIDAIPDCRRKFGRIHAWVTDSYFQGGFGQVTARYDSITVTAHEVTSRWLESLLSGCIVAGKRPVSRMADDMLSWPGATVELADDPEQAGEEVRDLLSRNDELAVQRRSNIRHMLLHHDWRDRIRKMCQLFELPVASAPDDDLGCVHALAQRFA